MESIIIFRASEYWCCDQEKAPPTSAVYWFETAQLVNGVGTGLYYVENIRFNDCLFDHIKASVHTFSSAQTHKAKKPLTRRTDVVAIATHLKADDGRIYVFMESRGYWEQPRAVKWFTKFRKSFCQVKTLLVKTFLPTAFLLKNLLSYCGLTNAHGLYHTGRCYKYFLSNKFAKM